MISKEEQQLLKEKKKALLQGKLEEAAAICNLLGSLKSAELNYDEALGEHQEELALSEKFGKLDCIAVGHRRVGEMLAKMGRYTEAINHHKLYLEMAENCGDSVEVQRAWATVGWTNFNYYSAIMDEEIEEPLVNMEKILTRAQFAFSSSLGCVEKLKGQVSIREFSEMKARLLLNVALIYDQRNMMQECSTSLRKAIHLCKSNSLTEDLHRCQYSLAGIYFSRGEVDLANSAIDQAMNSAKVLRNLMYMTDALILKSKLQLSKTDYKSGKRYAKKAYKRCLPASKEMVANFLKNVIGLCNLLERFNKTVDNEARCDLHEQIADVFSFVRCFQLAIDNYKCALSLAQDLKKENTKIASIYFSLAKTYADSHDYAKAIEFWKKEIECNKGNETEICSTLFEIAKTQEKQGCSEDSIQETLNEAVEVARSSKNVSLECRTLEKLQNFCIRHGKVPSQEISGRLDELQDKAEVENDSNDEVALTNSLEQFLDNINLSELSDFSDSDEDNSFNVSEKGSRQRRPLQIRKNEKGETPLHRACISGNLKQVKNLIQQGHPVNPRDFSGWLPIHEASNYGLTDIVEYLIDNGAWINDKGGDYCGGVTPLHDAAIGGHLNVIRLLISKGASVLAVTNSGETPLHCLQEWRKEMEGELNDNTLSDLLELENLMKNNMSERQRETKSKDKCKSTSASVTASSSGWVMEDAQPDKLPEKLEDKAISEMEVDDQNDDCILNNPLLDSEEIVNDWEDPVVARNEYEAAITSMRTKSVRKIEKRPDEDIDNPLHIGDSWIVNDTGVKPKIGGKKRKRTLDDYMFYEKTPASPTSTVDNIVSKGDFNNDSIQCLACRTIAVHICGETFVVPIPDPSLSFGWLAERAADSYYETHNTKPKLTLLRKDGAIFAKSDSLASFQDSSINAQVDSWDDFSFLECFSQACQSLNVSLTREVEKEVNLVEDSGSVNVMIGSVLCTPYLKPLLKALKFQSALRSLSFNELCISTDVLDMLCKAIPTLVGLVYLNLKCCSLDCSKLLQITNAINNNRIDSRKYQLKQFDLSFNSLNDECASILKTLLSCFPLLENVNLAFCDLPDIFRNEQLVHVIQNLIFLKELNISGNRLSRSALNDYLRCIGVLNLYCLDLSYTFSEHNFGRSFSEHLVSFGNSLRMFILRDCNLSDSDFDHIASFISHCTRLEEIDVSFNHNVTLNGLMKITKAAKEHDLPLLSLTFTGLSIQHNSRDLFLELLHVGHLKRMTFSIDMLDDLTIELLKKEWLLLWEKKACVSLEDFNSVIFSA